MQDLYQQIVINLRGLLGRILEPTLDLEDFLSVVARSAKQLDPEDLEARVYEVDFNENLLFLRTSTQVDVNLLPEQDKTFTIKPNTITGDAAIENRVITANKDEGYAQSRFVGRATFRAAFPIEFYDNDLSEGRTKYVLVVEKGDASSVEPAILAALKDYSILAGLAISIKELRDRLSRYYEENRNLVLTGQHAAAIGHDIRSLNIGVGGYLKVALRHLEKLGPNKAADQAGKYTRLARDNAGQVEALLKNFAHFNLSHISLNRDLDLAEAVAEKIYSMKNRIDWGRFLDFDLSLPDGKTGFMVDGDWFGTVVENLVKNSLEACGGATRIAIRLEKPNGLVRLTFEDNCGGIPADILANIFTPFKSGKKYGQGLGLANARKVVEDHGGTMNVNNRTGQGAVFTIDFPWPASGED